MSRLRLAYLFTTFPTMSETFLQREVRAMRERPVDFTLHSIWQGEKEWEGLSVECFNWRDLFRLVWWLPYWFWRKPRAMLDVVTALTRHPPPSLLNFGENLLGLGFALVHARQFELRTERPHLCHAVWATTPAAAGWMFERLLGIPYTMGAHAFDVFQNGGDWLLEDKLRHARLIHTTTAATRARLLERGANPARMVMIRRGLDAVPPLPPRRASGKVIHLLAIGRLIPKKGYFDLLRVVRHLRDGGIEVECRIVGGGPLQQALRARIRELALEHCVHLLGALPYVEVAKLQQEWADVFIFNGRIAPDGDRDGLPNVIPEAMATGVPVVTSPVAGTTEAIAHGETGFVVAPEDWNGWREAIVRAARDAALVENIRRQAHAWVKENFDSGRNATSLAEAVRHAVMGHRNLES